MPTKLLDEYCRLLLGAGTPLYRAPKAYYAGHLATIDTNFSVAALPELPSFNDDSGDDVLLVIDMQNDFLPGGAFGVTEGDAVVDVIHHLLAEGGYFNVVTDKTPRRVYFTRDYHPKNHCSFSACGGPFPAHCVQGTAGSEFEKRVAGLITQRRAEEKKWAAQNKKSAPYDAVTSTSEDMARRTTIVFKGFSPDIDSFSAFPYTPRYGLGQDPGSDERSPSGGHARVTRRLDRTNHCGCTWTGSFVLDVSDDSNSNAPPDVMAVLSRRTLREDLELFHIKKGSKPTAFIVGLAFDFCVIDTALNALKTDYFSRVVILLDGTRAAAHPGGFFTDASVIARHVEASGGKLLLARIG